MAADTTSCASIQATDRAWNCQNKLLARPNSPNISACMDFIACGAKTRSGLPCNRLGKHGGGRCYLHGGLSTGPRTLAGKLRNGITLKLYRRGDLGSIAPKVGKASARRRSRALREAIFERRRNRVETREQRWARKQAAKTGLPFLPDSAIESLPQDSDFVCEPVSGSAEDQQDT